MGSPGNDSPLAATSVLKSIALSEAELNELWIAILS